MCVDIDKLSIIELRLLIQKAQTRLIELEVIKEKINVSSKRRKMQNK